MMIHGEGEPHNPRFEPHMRVFKNFFIETYIFDDENSEDGRVIVYLENSMSDRGGYKYD